MSCDLKFNVGKVVSGRDLANLLALQENARFDQVIRLQFCLDFLGYGVGEIDGIYGQKTKNAYAQWLKTALDQPRGAENALVDVIKSIDDRISSAAFALIAYFEGGGRYYYEKFLSKPTIPTASSGITIGLGYDLYYEKQHIKEDLAFLGEKAAQILYDYGTKALNDRESLAKLQSMGIKISYYDALILLSNVLKRYCDLTFSTFELDKWEETTGKKFPCNCAGSLVSLVYNRGASLLGTRRWEMRSIKKLQLTGNNLSEIFVNMRQVPGLFRSMKRLWPDASGLAKRRDFEARLYECGLDDLKAISSIGGH